MDELTKKHDKILVSSEFKFILPFRNLLSKVCLLAILTKGVEAVEVAIEERRMDVASTQREIEGKDVLMKHMDIVDLLNDDLNYMKGSSMVYFVEKEGRIK